MENRKLFLRNKMYNYFMDHGKKFLCEKIFLKSFKIIQKNINKNHQKLTKLAFVNITPVIELRQIKKKKRKTVKEFPFVLNKKNRTMQSIKTILSLLRKKSGSKSQDQISSEFILSAQSKSIFLKSKKSNQQYALLKKKYVFFRWFC